MNSLDKVQFNMKTANVKILHKSIWEVKKCFILDLFDVAHILHLQENRVNRENI